MAAIMNKKGRGGGVMNNPNITKAALQRRAEGRGLALGKDKVKNAKKPDNMSAVHRRFMPNKEMNKSMPSKSMKGMDDIMTKIQLLTAARNKVK